MALKSGTVHKLPKFISDEIKKSDVVDNWQSLTPLARNEWICWITSSKKEETKQKRINWMFDNLNEGKKRPCCWPGCPHRNIA